MQKYRIKSRYVNKVIMSQANAIQSAMAQTGIAKQLNTAIEQQRSAFKVLEGAGGLAKRVEAMGKFLPLRGVICGCKSG